MKMKHVTNSEFINAIKNSLSIREVLKCLNLKPSGGNYKVFYRKILLLNLDISHFTGKGHLKGKTHNWSNKTPLETILVENSTYGGGTYKLKNKLLKEKLFEHKCYNCNNTEWQGKPIPLELEHKNGNNIDNQIENLTLPCPNCHALTETYRGKNKGKKQPWNDMN